MTIRYVGENLPFQKEVEALKEKLTGVEVALEETGIQLLLETRGQAHVKEIIAAIERDGLIVK